MEKLTRPLLSKVRKAKDNAIQIYRNTGFISSGGVTIGWPGVPLKISGKLGFKKATKDDPAGGGPWVSYGGSALTIGRQTYFSPTNSNLRGTETVLMTHVGPNISKNNPISGNAVSISIIPSYLTFIPFIPLSLTMSVSREGGIGLGICFPLIHRLFPLRGGFSFMMTNPRLEKFSNRILDGTDRMERFVVERVAKPVKALVAPAKNFAAHVRESLEVDHSYIENPRSRIVIVPGVGPMIQGPLFH